MGPYKHDWLLLEKLAARRGYTNAERMWITWAQKIQIISWSE
jgi:hypothetical protein